MRWKQGAWDRDVSGGMECMFGVRRSGMRESVWNWADGAARDGRPDPRGGGGAAWGGAEGGGGQDVDSAVVEFDFSGLL
jgi:hypothetical protein